MRSSQPSSHGIPSADSRTPSTILALDFGGTKNTCAVFVSDEHGAFRMDSRVQRSSPARVDAEYDYTVMLELAAEALQGASTGAIGVSFGGPVRASEGEVVLSHHVPGWEAVPLRARLESRFGVRVAIDNDANAAALGESRYGAGRGGDLFYITVSTGVGGGWILNGEIYRGTNELAGEIGHMVIDPNGPPCVCGRRGCVEQLACGPAIARNARDGLLKNPHMGPVLRTLIENNLSQLTARDVNQAALRGDSFALACMESAAQALGFAIGNVIVLMNPPLIVLGGGVINAGAYYLDAVRRAARANVMPELRDAVEIVPAALGDDAPLWGALALVLSS